MFGYSETTLLNGLIFLAAATLAYSVMNGLIAREAVRRRASRVGVEDGAPGNRRSLRFSGIKAAQKLIDYTTKHYSAADSGDMKVLRRRLVEAGIYDPHAPAYYFLARAAAAVGFAVAAYFGLSLLGLQGKTSFWLFVMGGGGLGYLAPSIFLDRRIAARRLEHQAGFPDFMDLLVVCADAGRTMTEALNHLGDRLGLEEARSFATLIQQSDELGSSISDALRVYSDDMRHKRLSRAEEKAYSLPAKLSVPMMVCIFPVLFIVILCPVIVRVATGMW